MPQHARTRVAVLILALLLSGCGRERPTFADEPAVSSTTSTTTTLTRRGQELADRASVGFENAVDQLVLAPSYRFESSVELTTSNSEVTIDVTGWVEGADRELVLTTDAGKTTTRVVDSIATVERDGDTVEVALEAASKAPSLKILHNVTSLSFAPDDTLQGKLTSTALRDAGFNVDGAASVTATITNGMLSAYSIAANNGAWTINTQFTDVGALTR